MTKKDINSHDEDVNEAFQGDVSPEDNAKDETVTNSNEEKNPLDVALAEVDDLKKQLLYKAAEFENFRKRTIAEKTELILSGGQNVIKAILPILDDMERAIQNADKTEDVKVVEEGWELIAKKLNKTLENLGVQKMVTENADFNTDFHEAVAMIPNVDDDKKGKVIDCIQAGYMLNDKVLRHAKVAVGE